MKQLLKLTFAAVILFAVACSSGCNKTSKVNAAATASQCGTSECSPANCDMAACASKAATCIKLGANECPLAAAKANAKPAAAGDASGCCSSKANAKPAAAGDASGCCSSKANAKPAAAGNPSCCSSKK